LRAGRRRSVLDERIGSPGLRAADHDTIVVDQFGEHQHAPFTRNEWEDVIRPDEIADATLLAWPDFVAYGANRTSTRRQPPLNPSKMTICDISRLVPL
jgi:hypothetical protein